MNAVLNLRVPIAMELDISGNSPNNDNVFENGTCTRRKLRDIHNVIRSSSLVEECARTREGAG